MNLLDTRCKHWLHALVDRDVGSASAAIVKVWDAMHDQMMEVEGVRVDLYCTRKEAGKVLYVPERVNKYKVKKVIKSRTRKVITVPLRVKKKKKQRDTRNKTESTLNTLKRKSNRALISHLNVDKLVSIIKTPGLTIESSWLTVH